MEAVHTSQTEHSLAKVDVIVNPNYERHGTKSYVRLMARFGFQPTKDGPYFHVDRSQQHGLLPEKLKQAFGHAHKEKILVKKIGSGDNAKHGEVTAEDQQNDSLYLCEVLIGTPPQKLLLDLDTGSADLWVFSTEQSTTSRKGHNVFDPHKSKTFKALSGMKWQIQYGDGSTASGDCGADILSIGGLKVEGQTIECASKMSEQFSKSTGDGLLGLGWSKINTVTNSAGKSAPQLTPVENMIKQGRISKDAELFTSCFYSSRDPGKADKSFFTFGSIDTDLVKVSGEEDFHWVDVDKSKGFWMFPSESASIGEKQIKIDGNVAIADTGTTLALLSDKVVEALYDKIPGATYDYFNQGYIIPASTKDHDFPELKVAVGDKEFLIQTEDLAFAPTDDGENWYGGVQSRGTLPFDILGDTFLKSCYCAWDVGKSRFGIVPKIENMQNLEPPGEEGNKHKDRVFSVDMISSD